MRARSLPDDLRAKALWPEDLIEQHLQVVTRGRVAVEVEGARWLEDPVQFDKSDGHLHEVGHHLVLADPRT